MTTPLGKRVRKLRAWAEPLSARELATLVGLHPSAISHLEAGRTEQVQSNTLARLGQVLGCSADYLLHGHGEPSRDEVLRAVSRARAHVAAEAG